LEEKLSNIVSSIKIDTLNRRRGFRRDELLHSILLYSENIKPESIDKIEPLQGVKKVILPVSSKEFYNMKKFRDYNGNKHRVNFLKIVAYIDSNDLWDEIDKRVVDFKKKKRDRRAKRLKKRKGNITSKVERVRQVNNSCKDILWKIGISKDEVRFYSKNKGEI